MIENPNDPSLRSFIDVAPESHFPMQNLPFGVCERQGVERICVAIGEFVVDLFELQRNGLLPRHGTFRSVANIMADGPAAWREMRQRVSVLLRHDNPKLRDNAPIRDAAIVPRQDVKMLLPCPIPNYTDFYSSREHATNVGIMLRGADNALMPNWLHLPVAYHGRASSVVVSGTDVPRPSGQTKADDATAPVFGPSRSVDFELELGTLIGQGNELGKPISVHQAAEHVFGMVLVNDWSARDVQKWEYQPLGPFLA